MAAGSWAPTACANAPRNPRGGEAVGDEIEAGEIGASLKFPTAMVERATDRSNADLNKDESRRNDDADRDGEDEFGCGGAGLASDQAKKWPVAGMDTTAPDA